MSVDPRTFRDAMGHFATGVTVVTMVRPDGAPDGVTVNSFNSVSLDPPLVLFSLRRQARSLRYFLDSAHFAVNILRDDQVELSRKFASPVQDLWDGVAYQTWESGCPILDGALASFECEIAAKHDGGDHVIFVGRVQRMAHSRRGKPLLYYRGDYKGLWETR